MFRASLCPSSGEQAMLTTACGVCLVVLAAVVQSWDTSCVHCVKVGIPKLVYQPVVYIVCSPDDGHNDARNMLS